MASPQLGSDETPCLHRKRPRKGEKETLFLSNDIQRAARALCGQPCGPLARTALFCDLCDLCLQFSSAASVLCEAWLAGSSAERRGLSVLLGKVRVC